MTEHQTSPAPGVLITAGREPLAPIDLVAGWSEPAILTPAQARKVALALLDAADWWERAK